MLEATVDLLYALLKMNFGRSDHYLNLYKALVILIFSTTLQLSADIQQTSINDVVAKMQLFFSDWISGGKDMCGGERNLTVKTAVAELTVGYIFVWHNENDTANLYLFLVCFNPILYLFQIWESLFSAECPLECTHHWHGVIKNIVESRVNEVRFAHAANSLGSLFCNFLAYS